MICFYPYWFGHVRFVPGIFISSVTFFCAFGIFVQVTRQKFIQVTVCIFYDMQIYIAVLTRACPDLICISFILAPEVKSIDVCVSQSM